jgi:hypothetical protein
MLYQLPNGKVIEISLEYYLALSDEELDEFTRLNIGVSVENPFFNSALDGKHMIYDDSEIDSEIEPELPDLDFDHKLNDQDFLRDDI